MSMKLHTTRGYFGIYGTGPIKTYSIQDAVEALVESEAFGAVEQVQDSAGKTVRFVGELVEMLHAKSVLSDDDVQTLLGGDFVKAEP